MYRAEIAETLAAAKCVLPADAVVIRSDSGSLSDAQSLGDEVKKHTDRLDGVFLNAGVGQFNPFETETPQRYDDMFNINVRGPYFSSSLSCRCLAIPAL